ncbi:endonuclease domain-containing protein [Microbacterium jepli]|uniref:endonuclease domain-containing protein n=1 Tax=unclassified Microbacterium TaxID=2609290 RepID=UPI00399FAB4B
MLRHGVYADAGYCAAVRDAAAHGGALACISAARHLGLWVLAESDTVHVALGPHGHRHRHDDCSCVEHWDAGGPRRGLFDTPGIRVILRQILGCCGPEDFFVALESALHLGLLDVRDLPALRAEYPASAREAISLARADAESGLESLFRWRLRHRRLSIRTQVRVASVGRADVVIGDRLLVEVDGADNHDSRSHRHRDLVRDAHAAAWGFVTLRFDYAMVVHDWHTVELAVMASIDRGLHLDPARP